mgnify:CR=1 FL=1
MIGRGEGGDPRLALLRKSDKKLIEISYEGREKQGSRGEGALLLMCAALALAESTGSRMPIVLEDCFDAVDPDVRGRLVKAIGKNFQNLIFATNDPANAQEMDNYSEGTLHFSVWPEKSKGIITGDDFEWYKWSEIDD